MTLAVQRELQSRLTEADRLRHAQVERAQYESELAQRRFMRVDPDNRLVADSLEAQWNEKLRALAEAREQYTRRKEQDQRTLSDDQHRAVMALASDFPRLWRDPATSDRDRKRMVRLLLEDVTLNRDDQLSAQIRFKGGACRQLRLPLPLCAWQQRVTPPAVIVELDRLLDDHTVAEIADILNERGMTPGAGKLFHPQLVARLARTYHLKARYDRLRQRGMLTLDEVASALHITPHTVKIGLRRGLLRGHAYNDKNESLYEPLDGNAPSRSQGVSLSRRGADPVALPDRAKEVQYAA